MPSFFHSKVMTVLLCAACAWLLLVAAGSQVRHLRLGQQLQTVQDRIGAEQRENERLARQLERMKHSSWLALLARTRLNYKKPGESVVFVYKSEKSGTISQPQSIVDTRRNWQKWWDWVRDR